VSSTDDQLIADYMSRLDAAAAILPPDRRAELLDEITVHIAEARAHPHSGDAGGTATVLDRLGSPDDIVRAAAEHGGTGGGVFEPGSPAAGGGPPGYTSPPAYGPPGWQAPPGYGPAGYPGRTGLGAMEVIAIVLLLIGGFLAGIGWIVGVILLWLSPRWRLSDKLLGTLVWPGGLAGVLVGLGLGAVVPVSVSGGACSGSDGPGQAATSNCVSSPGGLPGWLTVTLVLLAVVISAGAPIVVTVRLVRQARRWPGELPGTAAARQPL
jgi:hypothetical protein